MSKRKFISAEQSSINKRRFVSQNTKKHTLDSDEEDEVDENEGVLDANDIEGEEEGVARQDDGVRMTAFNMKEEMEEGHFDKQGHFIWRNESEIRDNWLDNVDWHKVNKDDASKYHLHEEKGLGDESDEGEAAEEFDETKVHTEMLKLMRPKETVNKAIKRLGGENSKLSSIERLKRKKAGTLNSNQDVTNLTEFANSILTKTGNMDIYQETYEQISAKIKKINKPNVNEPVLDMYSDDFDSKEKHKIETNTKESEKDLMWEFKWDQNKDETQGPYDTRQMIKWKSEGYFKSGVWVRKCGEKTQFYTSNRIDFELYE